MRPRPGAAATAAMVAVPAMVVTVAMVGAPTTPQQRRAAARYKRSRVTELDRASGGVGRVIAPALVRVGIIKPAVPVLRVRLGLLRAAAPIA